MAQPLSKVMPGASSLNFSPELILERPELAKLVMLIIGHWPFVEQELSLLLPRLLGTEHLALPVFSFLRSKGLQAEALKAVAEQKFGGNPEDIKTFSAVLGLANRVGKHRHKLVHWRWGVSPQLPEDLLLIDPTDMKRLSLHHQKMNNHDAPPPMPPSIPVDEWLKQSQLDYDRILVYTRQDLERERDEFVEVCEVLSWYNRHLNPIFSEKQIEERKELARSLGQPWSEPVEWTREGALARMFKSALFRAARA